MLNISEMFRKEDNIEDLIPDDLKQGLIELNIKYHRTKKLFLNNEHKSNLKWVKEPNDKQLIKRRELYCIYNYLNGDTAWFSILDKHIYDFNHELGMFNKFSKDQHLLWKEQPYKKWLKDIKSETHVDAWKDKK